MRIYCNCNFCGKKVMLNSHAATRQQLSNSWGRYFNITCPLCRNNNHVDVNSVKAESSYKAAPVPSVVLGGGVGALFGPLGLIVGLILGGATGGAIRTSDSGEVNRFNNYYV